LNGIFRSNRSPRSGEPSFRRSIMDAASHPVLLLLEQHQRFPRLLAERFPHVLARIVEAWHSPTAMEACISDLMLADPRRKQGFPQEAMLEIFAISRLHDTLYPKSAKSGIDVWSRSQEL